MGEIAFISYAREDSVFAKQIAADLKAARAEVWLDQLDIRVGQRWDREVEEALARCPRVILILSPAAVASTNVMDEVSFALDERKPIIPLIHRDCRVPFRLRRLQYVDFRSDYQTAFKTLVSSLKTESSAQARPFDDPVKSLVGPAATDQKEDRELSERERAEAAVTAERVRLEREWADELAKVERQRLERDQAEAKAKAERQRLERERAAASAKSEQQRFQHQKAEAAAKAERQRLERERAAALFESEQQRSEREKADAADKAERQRLGRAKAENSGNNQVAANRSMESESVRSVEPVVLQRSEPNLGRVGSQKFSDFLARDWPEGIFRALLLTAASEIGVLMGNIFPQNWPSVVPEIRFFKSLSVNLTERRMFAICVLSILLICYSYLAQKLADVIWTTPLLGSEHAKAFLANAIIMLIVYLILFNGTASFLGGIVFGVGSATVLIWLLDQS